MTGRPDFIVRIAGACAPRLEQGLNGGIEAPLALAFANRMSLDPGQGLFNDARAQYLQVAEDFMKNGDLEQSVRLFQKVLEMDPENVPMRIKLAEVYVKLGKKKEALADLTFVREDLKSWTYKLRTKADLRAHCRALPDEDDRLR